MSNGTAISHRSFAADFRAISATDTPTGFECQLAHKTSNYIEYVQSMSGIDNPYENAIAELM